MDPRDMLYSTLLIPFPCKLPHLSSHQLQLLFEKHKPTSLLQHRNPYDHKKHYNMDPKDMYYSTLLIPFHCKLVYLSLQPFPPFNDRGKPTSLLHHKNPYDHKKLYNMDPRDMYYSTLSIPLLIPFHC